jgi:hypothetical protein
LRRFAHAQDHLGSLAAPVRVDVFSVDHVVKAAAVDMHRAPHDVELWVHVKVG